MWPQDWEWLDTFWDVVIADQPGRSWQVSALFDADLWIRDAYAWGLVREYLREGGRRVRCEYVRAWGTEPEVPLPEMSGRDIIFLGRTKTYESSRFATYAHKLGSETHARFIDAFDGRLGNSLTYGKRAFARHDVETPSDHYRRVDIDHAVIAYRRADVGFEWRRLLGISGLSTLGTLCAVLVLLDPKRRRELLRQVREVAPWDPALRPEESFELCLRTEVDSEARLANFLNDPRFHFRVEVVAAAGGEPRMREERPELVLRPSDRHGRRDTVSLRGTDEHPLTASRFHLLRRLVERGGTATQLELCRDLGLLTGDLAERGVPDGRRPESSEDVRLVKRKIGVLARMVHDVNVALHKIPGTPHDRLIQIRHGRYELIGVRAVIRP